MSDRGLSERIASALRKVPQQEEEINPAVLGNIVSRMASSMRPAQPLPGFALTVTRLLIAVAGLATLGAAVLGMHGIEAMGIRTEAAICISLLALVFLAASSSVQFAIPGSRNWTSASTLLVSGVLVPIALFGMFFDDYTSDRFIREGMRCLTAGLFQAAPVALLIWYILRRHFAVRLNAAMIARGTLAGLGGLIMLELHCPRLQVLHLAIWHTAVLPVCAGIAIVVYRWYGVFRKISASSG